MLLHSSTWWIIAFVLSVCLCVGSITNMWNKYSENPVILRFNDKTMSIGDVPFPAVTICPLNKVSSKKLNYTDVYRSMLKLDGDKSRNITENEYEYIPPEC